MNLSLCVFKFLGTRGIGRNLYPEQVYDPAPLDKIDASLENIGRRRGEDGGAGGSVGGKRVPPRFRDV